MITWVGVFNDAGVREAFFVMFWCLTFDFFLFH